MIESQVDITALDSLKPYNDRIILTGAGFSKNWGGYDAGEMCDVLLRNLDRERLRQVVRSVDRLNFEDPLAEVELLNPTAYEETDRVELRAAVRKAYDAHDAKIRSAKAQHTAWLNKLVTAIADRANPRPLTSCLFTLNQDLLLERYCTTGDQPKVTLPCVSPNQYWFGRGSNSPCMLDLEAAGGRSELAQLAQGGSNFLNEIRHRLSYIKLHGSIDWKDPQKGDVLVIGGGKEEVIAQFPALHMALRVFEHALMSGSVHLLVIGYGFGDGHINRAIGNAVRDAELRLHVVDTMPRDELRRRLNSVPGAWDALVDRSSNPADDAIGLTEGARWKPCITKFLQG